ncbi:MAG: TesB-like acyl-CoA thioesterase 2, partial [uncultured Ramlibacter sp.]
ERPSLRHGHGAGACGRRWLARPDQPGLRQHGGSFWRRHRGAGAHRRAAPPQAAGRTGRAHGQLRFGGGGWTVRGRRPPGAHQPVHPALGHRDPPAGRSGAHRHGLHRGSAGNLGRGRTRHAVRAAACRCAAAARPQARGVGQSLRDALHRGRPAQRLERPGPGHQPHAPVVARCAAASARLRVAGRAVRRVLPARLAPPSAAGPDRYRVDDGVLPRRFRATSTSRQRLPAGPGAGPGLSRRLLRPGRPAVERSRRTACHQPPGRLLQGV